MHEHQHPEDAARVERILRLHRESDGERFTPDDDGVTAEHLCPPLHPPVTDWRIAEAEADWAAEGRPMNTARAAMIVAASVVGTCVWLVTFAYLTLWWRGL